MSRPTSKQATPLTIAAIDFGTTGTGYAYKLRKQDGASSVGGDQGWTGITEVGLQVSAFNCNSHNRTQDMIRHFKPKS